jgi:hypothetical protein
MPSENEILDLVLSSIETGLDEHHEHVVFQQLRVAPESLIVHLAAFQIHMELEKQWPGQFDVRIEHSKCDLKIVPKNTPDEPFLFEFKIPWSGGFILADTADDFDRKLGDNPRVFEVTVFLRVVNRGEWHYRQQGSLKPEDYRKQLPKYVESKYPGLKVQLVKEGNTFSLILGDARMECTVMIWKVEQVHKQLPNEQGEPDDRPV